MKCGIFGTQRRVYPTSTEEQGTEAKRTGWARRRASMTVLHCRRFEVEKCSRQSEVKPMCTRSQLPDAHLQPWPKTLQRIEETESSKGTRASAVEHYTGWEWRWTTEEGG